MVVVGADSNLPSAVYHYQLTYVGVKCTVAESRLSIGTIFPIGEEFEVCLPNLPKTRVLNTKLYASQNILFYFTTTTSLNYEGLKKFFNKPENQRTVNSIENVLILESIQSSGPYYLEVQVSSLTTQTANDKL